MLNDAGSVETVKEDIGRTPADIVRRWRAELNTAEGVIKDWHKKGEGVLERYRDEEQRKSSRFNVLHSNTEVLKPAVYSQTPLPDVRRRVTDPQNPDPVARDVAIVLERALSHSMDEGDFDEEIEQARDDFLLPGRGVARELYIPTSVMGEPRKAFIDRIDDELLPDGVTLRPRFFVGEEEFPADQVINPGSVFSGERLEDLHEDIAPHVLREPKDEVVYEEVRTEYVFWKDYLESPARTWREVRWTAYRRRLNRTELRDQFPRYADQVTLDWAPKGAAGLDDVPDFYKRATVWEIWDKESRKVYIIAEGFEAAPLDVWKDPLRLEGFFPGPDPLDAIRTTDKRVPKPVYEVYEDQAKELDRITQRITTLINMLKVRGVYDASEAALAQILKKEDGTLVPMHNFAELVEKGGLDRVISFMPLREIAEVLVGLYEQRERIKQVIYEITGLSDIIRGATDPRETKGAQVLKAEFGSLRLQNPQKKVQRFVRDILRIKAEIIAEHFSKETLSQISGRPVTDEMMELLRSDGLRGFRIDIETDSTVQIDAGKEKQESVEMITAVTGFIQQAGTVVQAVPQMTPFLLELLKLGLRAFKPGRLVEESLEEMAAQVTQAQQQQQQPEDGEAQAKMAEMQIKAQELKAKIQRDQTELEMKQQESAAKLKLEEDKAMLDAQVKREDIAARKDMKAAELNQAKELAMEKLVAEFGPSILQALQEAQQNIVQSGERQAAGLALANQQGAQALAEAVQALVQAAQVLAAAAQTIGGPKEIVFEGEGRNRKPVGIRPVGAPPDITIQ